MDNWGQTMIKYYVVFALEPSHRVETFRILTDNVLFVLFTGQFFEAASLEGVVMLSWIEKLDMNRSKSVSEILEAYDSWAWDVSGIDGCSSMLCHTL